MDFRIPADIAAYLVELDQFIEREIKPLQAQDDNERFFDHRREWARTDFEAGGLPRPEWEALLHEARRRVPVGSGRYAPPRGVEASLVSARVARRGTAAEVA